MARNVADFASARTKTTLKTLFFALLAYFGSVAQNTLETLAKSAASRPFYAQPTPSLRHFRAYNYK